MDCKEFQEYISPLVDNQIDETKKIEAEEHIKVCPSCYFDFKVESSIKNLVSERYQRATCPEYLKNQIILTLASQPSFIELFIESIKNLFARKYIRFSFALGVLLIVFFIFYNPFERTEKYYNELASLVYQNCLELRNHKFPEKTIFASNPEVVMNFISANGIQNPKMPKTDWKILAAGIESYNDYRAAHFLFQCEKDTVYMMECELENIYKTGYLSYIKKIHKDLANKKFVKVDHGNCSIILRMENGILMAFAMSADNKHSFEELIASLD